MSSGKASVLSTQRVEDLVDDDLIEQSVNELEVNIPFLNDLLQALVGDLGNKKATIALIYSMILNSRNRKVSAMQKMMTVVALKCHADNKLLSRFNKLHLTMSAASKINLVSTFCDEHEGKIVKTIKSGQDGKLNGDNLDIYVSTNDIRMSNKSKDYHFFATDWTPYRLTDQDFTCNETLKALCEKPRPELNFETFKPDLNDFRSNMEVLAARVLIDNLGDNFKWMELVTPNHIQHPLQEVMSRKTTSLCLPILLCNETKYEDCIKIMDSYEDMLFDWYSKAGRGDHFERLMIPVGGDQLTRVRLDGAKSLRMGAHTVREKFENLSPVVVEMFHTIMDFLEKTIKKFMKKSTGRDQGTLGHLQIAIERTSVNGNVKSRFKAHEEFVLLCGKAYILEAAMEHFGMESSTSRPTKNLPPDGIRKSHHQKRLAAFHETMGNFLTTLLGPLSVDEAPDPSKIELEVSGQRVSVNPENEMVSLKLQHGTAVTVVKIPVKTLKDRDCINIRVAGNNIEVATTKGDELTNYSQQFLQYYFILHNFKDAVKEGDVFRLSNMMKMMIPLFYDHSPLSKYMVECIDFIMKTDVLLPPKLAMQVRVAALVNPKGRPAKNKAADIQKENQVKDLKDLIRGLGSNKTEKSIVRISKAYPIIKDIVSSFDKKISFKDLETKHKSRSQTEDLEQILTILRKIRPFQTHPGRTLIGYRGIQNSVFCNLRPQWPVYQETLTRVYKRLRRGLPTYEEEDE